jgi:NADH-quinone oxidoreductase subunit H
MIEWLSNPFGFGVAISVVLFGVILLMVAYCIYFERKIAGWVQDRYGPNRVGPRGVLQPIADGLKFFLKEDFIPAMVNRPIFILAPGIIFLVACVGFLIIPWGGLVRFGDMTEPIDAQGASIDIGLLYLLAVASMGVYGTVLGGWASNNKYSFYGGLRAAAQLVSYEIPLGLAILVIVICSGEVRLERIVEQQAGTTWNVLMHPVACLMLMICAFAETNRAPFDLPEAEQELVGGYHTEYSSMKFALFFLAEYAHMITNSALIVALFFGGWMILPVAIPWLDTSTSISAMLLRVLIYLAKVSVFIFVYMWVRWTLPRFRFDQLMRLAWKGLVPIGLGLVAIAALLVYAGGERWYQLGPISIWATVGEALVVLLVWLLLRAVHGRITGRQENLPAVPETVPASAGS